MDNPKYITGTEPTQPDQKPQEGTEQTITGISGTTHGGKRTTQKRARAHVDAMRKLIRGE
jgi:hypothetical protein